jgi:hypothetical protein
MCGDEPQRSMMYKL